MKIGIIFGIILGILLIPSFAQAATTIGYCQTLDSDTIYIMNQSVANASSTCFGVHDTINVTLDGAGYEVGMWLVADDVRFLSGWNVTDLLVKNMVINITYSNSSTAEPIFHFRGNASAGEANSGITLLNVTTNGNGFGVGLFLRDTQLSGDTNNVKLEDVTVNNLDFHRLVEVWNSSNINLTDITVTSPVNNVWDFVLDFSNNSNVSIVRANIVGRLFFHKTAGFTNEYSEVISSNFIDSNTNGADILVSNVYIYDCNISGSSGNGIDLTSSNDNITIRDTTLLYHGGNGIDADAFENLTLDNVTIKDTGNGVSTMGGVTLNITDILSWSNGGTGVIIRNVTTAYMSGNVSYNLWHGVSLESNATDVTITNLQSHDNEDGFNADDVSYSVLQNAEIYGNDDDGMSFADSPGMQIININTYDNGDNGLIIDTCADFQATTVNLYNSPSEGIYMTGSDNAVFDDINSSYNTFGFYTDSTGCSSCNITGAYFLDNSNTGMHIEGSDGVYLNNITVTGGSTGPLKFVDSQDLDITYADFTDATGSGDGIVLHNVTRASFDNINVSNNNDYGVYVSGTDGCDNCNFTNSYVMNNADMAFYWRYSDNSVFDNLTIQNNDYGLYIRNSDSGSFNDIRVYDISQMGVYLRDTNGNSLSNLHVNNSVDFGVYLAQQSNSTTFADSVVENTGGSFYTDFWIRPTNCNTHTITNITGSNGRAIEFYNSNATTSDKYLSGLFICQATVTIDNITIDNYRGSFAVFRGYDTVIKNSYFMANDINGFYTKGVVNLTIRNSDIYFSNINEGSEIHYYDSNLTGNATAIKIVNSAGSNNVTMHDSSISRTQSGASEGAIWMTGTASPTNYNDVFLYNTTLQDYYVDNSTLTVYWWLTVVNPLNADVTIKNASSDVISIFNHATRQLLLKEFTVTPVNSQTNSTPHTVSGRKNGYLNLDAPVLMNISQTYTVDMGSQQPIGGGSDITTPAIVEILDEGEPVIVEGAEITGEITVVSLIYQPIFWIIVLIILLLVAPRVKGLR